MSERVKTFKINLNQMFYKGERRRFPLLIKTIFKVFALDDLKTLLKKVKLLSISPFPSMLYNKRAMMALESLT